MAHKTTTDLLAYWFATKNVARFQERFKAQTDDDQIKILAALLAAEFRKFERTPLH